MTRRIDLAGLAIAALLLAAAAMIWLDMVSLNITSAYGPGPKAMPIIVASGLVVLALGNAVMAFKGTLPDRDSLDWKAIILILGGLAVLIATIAFGGGFIPGTAILFAATAAAFGRRAFLTDLAIGLVISLITYILFSKLLTLSLPVGPLESLI